MDMNKKGLSLEKQNELLNLLKERFEQNIHRHENMDWNDIETKLKTALKSYGHSMKWNQQKVNRTLLVMIK